jgi:hypothetical protein
MRFHSTTGDNYEAKAGTLFDLLLRRKVNIFNISNINSEVRGGKSPRRREGPPRKIYTPSSRSARLTPASSSSSPSGVVCVSHTENAPGSRSRLLALTWATFLPSLSESI